MTGRAPDGADDTALIGIDWGTTNLRAYRLAADGRVLEVRTTGHGIARLPGGGFPEALATAIGPWREDAGAAVPVLMAGMVGARGGWTEVAYVDTPAGLEAIARGVTALPALPAPSASADSRFGAVHIVPGVIDRTGTPDVMRGEETQILGLDAAETEGPVCLPGTHSKWVAVEEGRIARFATFMTGEVHALMRRHSILSKTMPPPEDDAHDADAFARGVDRSGAPGGLLHHLFAARSLALTGALAEAAGPSYVSGLVIGHELRAATAAIDRPGPVTLVGAAPLVDRYAAALDRLDRPHCRAAPDAAARGLARLARLIRPTGPP